MEYDAKSHAVTLADTIIHGDAKARAGTLTIALAQAYAHGHSDGARAARSTYEGTVARAHEAADKAEARGYRRATEDAWREAKYFADTKLEALSGYGS